MPAPDIAELINLLFRTHLKSDGTEYTNKDVCQSLQGALEPSHLSRLRKGKIANPSRDTLLALCRFFRVPPSYFFPELEHETLNSPPPISAIDDSMLQVALRSTGITSDVQDKLEQLIKALRRNG